MQECQLVSNTNQNRISKH